MAREFTGKSVQDAIKTGLETMGLGIDEADIEIISEGGGGLFGIGAKKAVVRISPIDEDTDDDIKEAETKKGFSERAEEIKEKAESLAHEAAPKVEAFAKKAGAGAAIIAEDLKEKAAEIKEKADERGGFTQLVKEKATELKDDLEELADRAEEKLEDFGERIEARLEKEEAELGEGIEKSMDSTEHVKFLTEFLDGLFERMGISCTYNIMQKGDTLTVNIASNESGKLIGHRGETLDAIQYITRLAIHKQDLPYRSVIVQTENYREKREQTLRNLAKRLEAKVERTGRKINLEPMKPYERRIIHEELQGSETVITDSHGEEPNRYVVIMPKKDK